MQDRFNPNPLVAVVTPVYNGGKHLRDAIDSVQRQTYNNIVHIVLNNASTDDTADVLAEAISDFKNISVYRNDALIPLQENWNKAFSHLPQDAKYVMLLCADDMIHSKAIERFVDIAERDQEIETVMCHDVFADQVRRARLPDHGECILDGKDAARRMLIGELGWLPYCHFFVRTHTEFFGSAFCGDYWSQDPFVVMRSMLRGKFAYIAKPLVYTRYHEQCSTSAQVRTGKIKLHFNYLRLLNEFGPLVMSDHELTSVRNAFLEQMCRLYIKQLLKNKQEVIGTLMSYLADFNYKLSSTSLIGAIVKWPAHLIQKQVFKTPTGPRISDENFKNYVT